MCGLGEVVHAYFFFIIFQLCLILDYEDIIPFA